MLKQPLFNFVGIISRQVYLNSLQLVIAVLILMGSVVPFFSSVSSFSSVFYDTLSKEFILVASILLAIFILHIVNSYIEYNDRKFWGILLTLLSISVYSRAYYVLSFEQLLVSDFNTMWERARDVVANGWSAPISPQTERPIVSLTPLVFLFGDSPIVFKIFNIVAISLQNIIVCLLARQQFGYRAGMAAFFLLSLVPEFFFASLIPTHDISGAFYLILFIYIQFRLIAVYEKIDLVTKIVLMSALSVVGLLMEIQRGVYIIIFLANILFFAFHYLNTGSRKTYSLKKYIVILMVPCVLILITKQSLESAEILYDRKSPDIVYNSWNSFCNTHSFSKGDFSSCRQFYDEYAEKLSPEDRDYYMSALMYSDTYYNFKGKLNNYVNRIRRLMQFSTQNGFYYGRLQNVSALEQREINKLFSEISNAFSAVFAIAMLFLSTRLVLVNRDRHLLGSNIYYPFIFMGLVIILLGNFGENQPRYIYFGWPLWILGFAGFIYKDRTSANEIQSQLDYRALLFLLVLAAFLSTCFYGIMQVSDKKLIHMSRYSQILCSEPISESACSTLPLEVEDAFVDKPYSVIRLQHLEGLYKGASVAAHYKQAVEANKAYTLSLYVQSPYERKDKRVGYFSVNISINGKIEKTLSVADTSESIYVEVNDIESDDDQLDIVLEVVSNVNSKAVSWQRASSVNFKFMALRSQD